MVLFVSSIILETIELDRSPQYAVRIQRPN